MRQRGMGQRVTLILLLAVLIVSGGTHTAAAITLSSPNYKVTDTEFGAGSTLEGCSGQYCSRASIGDMAAGSSTSGSHSASFGSVTDSEPVLEVIVEEGESNLGVLSTEKTATKTTTIKIRNYQSEGYMLQIIGDPPKYGNKTLNTPSTPTAAQPGTEQFGINAVANTTP